MSAPWADGSPGAPPALVEPFGPHPTTHDGVCCAPPTSFIIGSHACLWPRALWRADARPERVRPTERLSRCGWALPLARLRAALLRNHRQLHGPADPLAAEADPRHRAQVDQRAVRVGQLRLPGLLRRRAPLLRRAHRSGRHQDRLCGLHRGLEPGRHVARARGQRERLHRGAPRARARRRGNFPSAIKAVAIWFPPRERAYATALFNSGSNVGAIIAPAIVPWLAFSFGWRSAFVFAGIAGLVWLAFWIPWYDIPERIAKLSASELAHIRSEDGTGAAPAAGDARVSWGLSCATGRPGPSSWRSS